MDWAVKQTLKLDMSLDEKEIRALIACIDFPDLGLEPEYETFRENMVLLLKKASSSGK